ncbi:MAG: hypothetical protein ABIF87_09370 [Pseudomonadota bacterium]
MRSFTEIGDLSNQKLVLLFTDRAEKGEGEGRALNIFRKEVLPEIGVSIKDIDVAICWANVGGILSQSDLSDYLKKRNLRGCGCFLLRNGEIIQHRMLGRFVALPKQYIQAAGEILEDHR